ncbi:MAG: oxyanion-translocating ATPase [Actinomycetia bacterium]|nr:oxyanion-translocating ATPase [Actinomycetes bacterium]
MTLGPAPSFGAVIERAHIVICCGTGGVGKTTTAAVLAIEGARRGRNAVVVTIDPAKRLAQTLGLEALSDTAHEIDRDRWDPENDAAPDGRLSALMLDSKTTFDALVTRYAATPDQGERILENRFYRNVSGALGGTQEYMAMEKLHELHEDGDYDLIVVDTPPTRHALDFLDAPARLLRLLDNRIFRLLMMPTRSIVRVAGVAVQAFLRTISRVVGTEVIDDVVSFFRAFEGMEAGFRDRAAAVQRLIAGPTTAFVLVTSARREAVEEAAFFADRLQESGLSVAALAVNRVHPSFGTASPEGLRERVKTLDDAPGDAAARARLAQTYANLADFRTVAIHERHEIDQVRNRIGTAATAFVPYLARDVHDFGALRQVGTHLFAPPTGAG